METTEKKEDLKAKIIKKYQECLLLEGHDPASVYAFCKELGIAEGDFYQHFNDFDQIASAFWEELFSDNLGRLTAAKEWETFSAREKLLSFYFSFFESVKQHRSYALLILKKAKLGMPHTSNEMSGLKEHFKKWIKELIAEGRMNDEIAGRSKLNDVYDDLFWFQFMFLLDFWKKDRTSGFESTDEAIEKAINLSFDLIEKNALDSAFDFGKFMFQNR
jgi:AcrR family transcriptional regulator